MTDEDRLKIIDYYFEAPNTKAVLEDTDINVTREEVGAFLSQVYTLLVETLPGNESIVVDLALKQGKLSQERIDYNDEMHKRDRRRLGLSER